MSDATLYRYVVDVIEAHDGDTLTLAVDLGFYIAHRVHIRLAGINAPELKTPEGKRVLTALRAFIADHPGQWTAQTFKTGEEKYGRWLARLFAPDGSDVSEWLLASGLAVPMSG